ncbi:ATP-binding protein [Algoriphagus sp. SE2]|uniref:ATP-binding protein n=1 Tax=Algoriphagus sp. SE2 TaxID=3141536 RepID=UPI0031CD83E5
MKINKIEENEIWQVYNTWLTAYLNADVKTYGTYLDEDYHFIGSTNNEEFLNRDDTKTFFERTGEQFSGIMDLRNEVKILEVFDRSIFITHFCDVWFLNDKDWAYYGRFRLSSVMLKKNEAWRFIYQHFSMPDSKSDEGETIGFDKVNAENIELKEAIKRRTIELESKNRELEVEGALERVRARSSAMQYSEELGQVIALIFNILDEFNISVKDGVALITFKEGSKDLNEWMANPGFDEAMNFHLPYFDHPVLSNLWQAKNRGEDFLIKRYSAEESRSFLNHIFEHSDFKHTPQSVKEYCLAARTYATSIALQKHTAIFINDYSGISLTSSELDLLKRFSVVFEQTYTRFLDIQKAEEQAREAQIEAALERIRSRSLAMHRSSELSEVVDTLLSEFTKLEFTLTFCIINLINEEDKSNTVWAANPETGKEPESYYMKFENYPFHHAMWDAWKAQKRRFVYTLAGEEKQVYDEYLFSETEFQRFPKHIQDANKSLERYVAGFTFFKHSGLQTVSKDYISDEDLEILERFGKVFEQSYTRFLDLQKAEAQVREAQIEGALERVRSRSMAMHHSSELSNVASIVFEQVKSLGFEIYQSWIDFVHETEDFVQLYVTDFGGMYKPNQVKLPISVSPMLELFQEWKSGAPFLEYELKGIEVKNWFELLHSLTGEPMFYLKEHPENFYYLEATNKYGSVSIASLEPINPELKPILSRFAKVFEQTYTRFIDLKKAEEQEREAEIQLALERVRSTSLAMHQSSDLRNVVAIVYQEVGRLNILDAGCNINIYNSIGTEAECWMAGFQSGTLPQSYKIRLTGHWVLKESSRSWLNKEPYYQVSLESEGVREFTKYLIEETGLMDLPAEFKEKMMTTDVEHTFFNMQYGQFHTVNTTQLSEEDMEVLRRFANVFEQTYTRFLDIQKAEAQARESEIQLALERVRASTMAMKSQSDLLDVIEVFGSQLTSLGINVDTLSVIHGVPKRDWDLWLHTPDSGVAPFRVYVPYIDTAFFTKTIKNIEAYERTGNFIHFKTFNKEEKDEFLTHYFSCAPPIPEEFKAFAFAQKQSYVIEAFLEEVTISLLKYGTENFSEEDIKIFTRFSLEFKQTYTRFLDLQKAEKQAKEAQIEAALEKVRSRSLAMHKSEEFPEVIQEVFEQLRLLNFNMDSAQFDVSFRETDDFNLWTAIPGQPYPAKQHIPYTNNSIFNSIKNAKEAGLDSIFEQFGKDEKNEFFEYFFHYYPDVSEERKQFILSSPGISRAAVLLDKVQLGIQNYSGIPYDESEIDILKRFGTAFEQTYTRFLDLEKAEKQARNSRVEVAVERVRAKALAMHNSSQILEVVDTLKNEMLGLEIQGVSAATIYLEEEEYIRMWDLSSVQESGDGFQVTLDVKFLLEETDPGFYVRKLWTHSEHYFIEKQEPDDMAITIEWLRKYHPDQASEVEEYLNSITWHYLLHPTVQLEKGKLSVDIFDAEVPEEMEFILSKMGAAFDLAYKRFLDLQKAEARAREAHIETALERVRSRTMGMQKADELGEVATVLFRELNTLVDNLWTCGFVLCEKNRQEDQWWLSLDNGLIKPFFLPNIGDYAHESLYEGWEKAESYRTVTLQKEKLQEHYDWLMNIPIAKKIFEEMEGSGISRPTWQRLHAAYFKTGYLVIITEVPCEEEEIFKRFAQVFDLTYTRFLDLQKAEAQAKEATKQASLDRVRGVIASMRTATDLELITPLIFKELTVLNVPFIRCGVFIINEKEENVEAFLSSPEGQSLGVLRLHYESNDLTFQTVKAWRKKEIFKRHWSKEDFVQWINRMMEQDQIQDSNTYQGTATPSESLDLHFVPFAQGMLYVGSVNPLDGSELEMVQSLANTFSVAFSRYEDFVKLEEAKAEIELAMNELKSTQAQLIQSEKMASLGELTAGIAHEIQNPLNFVNNFSEVNRELIDELDEEIEKGDLEEIKIIAADIRSNEQKINLHGKRADAIVKGMLDHSNRGSGQKELTNLNSLAEEFIRLSYQSFLAKEPEFKCELRTDFDPNLPQVSVIPQDIGKVLLNLLNNAFYACAERSRGTVNEKVKSDSDSNGDEGYHPEVIVKTKSIKSPSGDLGVELSVKDNGGGIPDSIKEKIFQPFFTTKPTGSGTGLGLSLSYDIVKAHGGELRLASHESQGSKFTIHLKT